MLMVRRRSRQVVMVPSVVFPLELVNTTIVSLALRPIQDRLQFVCIGRTGSTPDFRTLMVRAQLIVRLFAGCQPIVLLRLLRGNHGIVAPWIARQCDALGRHSNISTRAPRESRIRQSTAEHGLKAMFKAGRYINSVEQLAFIGTA
jgi:hypothetical protein